KRQTKGGSSKAPTSSKTSHSKKRKESNSTIDSNPSQPLVSTPVDIEMHKEEQQATSGPTYLVITSKARANLQLNSGMSVFNLNEPIYSASFIIHSESASGNNASAVSTVKADPGNSTPSDFLPQQSDQTKSVNEGLETVLTQHVTGKGASSIARQVKEEEASSTIKLEDLAKLVSNVQLMRFLALRWHLEEIHLTWAHLKKKQTRLRIYTKSLKELCMQNVETASHA
nr:hypothetical protein [Tanacetum cinerariifolium]